MKRKILTTASASILTIAFISLSGCTELSGDYASDSSAETYYYSEESSAQASETTEAVKTTVTTTEPPKTEPPVTETTLPDLSDVPREILPEYIPKYPYRIGNHLWQSDDLFYNNNVTYTNPWHQLMEREAKDGTTVLWETTENNQVTDFDYDRDAVIKYASEHWGYGDELCAEFTSDCISQGGRPIKFDSSTYLFLTLVNSGLGFAEFIPLNPDRTITVPDYAKPGDVIQIICSYEGFLLHSTVYSGNDENGSAMVYAHNPRAGGKTLRSYRLCYDCNTPIDGMYFFHFFEKGETVSKLVPELSDNVRLFSRSQRVLKGQSYNHIAALEYALNNRRDCLGAGGALHTTDCFMQADITVGYSNNSAILMQLFISGLGTAYTVPMNKDGTITLPDAALPGDAVFIKCKDEGMIIGSFIIKGRDDKNRAIAAAYDQKNDGTSAYIADGYCIGCGGDTNEVIVYHFNTSQ